MIGWTLSALQQSRRGRTVRDGTRSTRKHESTSFSVAVSTRHHAGAAVPVGGGLRRGRRFRGANERRSLDRSGPRAKQHPAGDVGPRWVRDASLIPALQHGLVDTVRAAAVTPTTIELSWRKRMTSRLPLRPVSLALTLLAVAACTSDPDASSVGVGGSGAAGGGLSLIHI